MTKGLEVLKMALQLIAEEQVKNPAETAARALLEAAKLARKITEPAPALIPWEPPGWVPDTAWGEFTEHRQAYRNIPFTDAAKEGVVRELGRLKKMGHDPARLLRSAVTNGWRTVYEPKGSDPRVTVTTTPSISAAQTQLYLASDRLTPEQIERNKQKAAELRRQG